MLDFKRQLQKYRKFYEGLFTKYFCLINLIHPFDLHILMSLVYSSLYSIRIPIFFPIRFINLSRKTAYYGSYSKSIDCFKTVTFEMSSSILTSGCKALCKNTWKILLFWVSMWVFNFFKAYWTLKLDVNRFLH